jgi:hypothetical protein
LTVSIPRLLLIGARYCLKSKARGHFIDKALSVRSLAAVIVGRI